MIFFYNSNGDLIKKSIDKVHQGSNRANKIWLFVPYEKAVVTVAYRLPNGTVLPESIMTKGEYTKKLDFNCEGFFSWYIDITSMVTAHSGDVVVQFYIKTIDGESCELATQAVCFSVTSGVAPKIDPLIIGG